MKPPRDAGLDLVIFEVVLMVFVGVALSIGMVRRPMSDKTETSIVRQRPGLPKKEAANVNPVPVPSGETNGREEGNGGGE